MKYLIQLFIFLLPFHAVFVTYLKCKAGIDTNLLRFWKEIVISLLLFIVCAKLLYTKKFNIKEIYKNNTLLGLITGFVICSGIYIFFPYFHVKISSLLGFKYDVFFLFAFVIGMYLASIKNNFDNILKSVFFSAGIIMLVFLPWYLFGDISQSSKLIGYSQEVSTYSANSCISFSQNVTGGHHRFQGSFGDPIRFSVFLVVFYLIYIGFVLHKELNNKILRNVALIIPSIFVLLSIFFSYTKTSMLGLLVGILLFVYLVRKIKYKRKISKKVIFNTGIIFSFIMIGLLYIKRALFLHPEAILGRVENLVISAKMFIYNPFGYGLGIAGPASQLATSSDSALSSGVTKFLPENWYIQILLEQGPVGLVLFLSVIGLIVYHLYNIMKLKKDFLSISIFVAFITILFMGNFTHIFEESATSYTLFMIMGAYIAKERREFK